MHRLSFRSLRSSLLLVALPAALLACGGDDDSATGEATPQPGASQGGSAGQAGGAAAGNNQGGASAGKGQGGAVSAGNTQGGAGPGGAAGEGGAGVGGAAGEGGAAGGAGGAAGEGGASGGAGDGGASGEAGQGGASGGAPAGELVIERRGARMRGLPLAISRTGRVAWVGTTGLPDPYDAQGKLRAGLLRYDLDSGEVQLLEEELPKVTYDWYGPEAGDGPDPTASVVEDGDRHLVVARDGVLVVSASGITRKALGSGSASPTHLVVDRAGGRKVAWASTSEGLLSLDADTLDTTATIDKKTLGGDVGPLAVDPATGDVYAAIYTAEGTSLLVHVAGGAVAGALSPADDTGAQGSIGDVVFSAKLGKALFAFATFDATSGGVLSWDGTTLATVVTEGQLGRSVQPAGEPAAFGPGPLSLDDDGGVLVVGGQLTPTGPLGGLVGGGLAFVELATGKIAGASVAKGDLPGDHVSAVAYDPVHRRAHALLRQPCSEVKLGNVGLVAVSFRDDGSVRAERPVLSGVRAFASKGGALLAGVRDDNPGLSCDGYPIQTGLLTLEGHASGEVTLLRSTTPTADILPHAGPVQIAVRDDGMVALGTYRDGGLIGQLPGGFVYNPTEYGTSLYQSAVAFSGPDALWIAGRATHDEGDPPILADRGPRGASLLTLTGSDVAVYRHYVRVSDDPKDVTGLPSSEVTSLVTSGKSAFLGCGIERLRPGSLDRGEGEPFVFEGATRQGGLVLVEGDGQPQTLVSSDSAPDVRAIALDGQGGIIMLDASKGALLYANNATSPFTLPAEPQGVSKPVSLFAAEGALVAGYDTGASVGLAGMGVWVDRTGYVWNATLHEGALLLGTDEGLVVVRPESVPSPQFAKATDGAVPPFATYEPVGSGGQCLKAGETCQGMPDACCPGLTCGGSGFVMQCQ